MTLLMWCYDVLLAGTLVFVAFRALASEDLLTAIALFVALGLTLTLAWVRLAAPDVALAEAGLGTGFTGALFLAALARLKRIRAAPRDEAPDA